MTDIKLEYNIDDSSIILNPKLDKLKYYSYIDIIPYELRVIVLSKLNENDKSTFNQILKENPEYTNVDNTLKFITGKNNKVYDLSKGNILEHPYIVAIYNEIINSKTDDKYEYFIEIIKSNILIYSKVLNTYSGGYSVDKYIKINPITFDMYSGGGRISKCNLKEEPWHGLDCINKYGFCMPEKKDRNIKIKVLEDRLIKK
jgi:hypothetical protein